MLTVECSFKIGTEDIQNKEKFVFQETFDKRVFGNRK